jgi:murein DD-endopeptidase MepM/ murein hydrolase activator NlpD
MNLYPGLNTPLVWTKPLDMVFLGLTDDSMSFTEIDIEHQVQIPINEHVGAFGAVRSFDVHKGVDLYAPVGMRVNAVEDGIVVCIRPFTGKSANCGWWEETMGVYISGRSGNVCYGEISPAFDLKVGDEIKAGQEIGSVLRVLKKDKGRPTSMLHLALLRHGCLGVGDWHSRCNKPKGLLDPTPLLARIMGV